MCRSAIKTGWYCHGNVFNAMTSGLQQPSRPRLRFLKTGAGGQSVRCERGAKEFGGERYSGRRGGRR